MIARLLLLSVGLLFAIPTGAAVLGTVVLADPAVRRSVVSLGAFAIDAVFADLSDGFAPDAAGFLAGISVGLFALLAVPPALAALVGGVLGWRSATAYGAVTGLLTALVPWLVRGGVGAPSGIEGRVTAMLFLAGAASGLVLGLFGREREARLSAPRP